MDHYLDIDILPDPEFTPNLLMNELVGKLHRALVELKTNNLGISFPRYDRAASRLGSKLRLHSSTKDLSMLMEKSWLTGMKDHIFTSMILEVPVDIKYLNVRRVQSKSNAERIRRRQMKRHGLSEKEACERVPETVERRLDLPFVTLKSSSTDQVFRLFIDQYVAEGLNPGSFNTYGLSPTASLPLF